MTWFQGAIATEPPGHESTKKEGVLVLCDVCRLGDQFFSQSVVARSGPEGIQRLLVKKGWEFDNSTGEDACPGCTLAVSA